ncbi:MAG TPA: hypothetical protein VFR02_03105 [bacterium]|nr:hypothetical protein [bacterium]
MPEYKILPPGGDLPGPAELLAGLQERGFSLEVNLSGPPERWEALRFYQDGPAEVECFLIRDEEAGALTASTPEGSPERAREILVNLADLILRSCGGTLEDPQTKRTFTAGDFREHQPLLKPRARAAAGWAWPAFAWAVTAASLAAWLGLPESLRAPALAVAALSLLSAAGLTWSALEK